MRVFFVGAVTAAVAAGAGLLAQTPSVQSGIYTTEQAGLGQALYEDRCVSCHGELTAFVPEMAALLADHTFKSRWQNRTVGELFELIQVEMPQDAPGTLSPEQTADLVAYILSGNRLPAGEAPLTGDVEQLRRISFEP